jgi:hypothetical protein
MHSNPGNSNLIYTTIYIYPVFTQRSILKSKRSNFFKIVNKCPFLDLLFNVFKFVTLIHRICCHLNGTETVYFNFCVSNNIECVLTSITNVHNYDFIAIVDVETSFER